MLDAASAGGYAFPAVNVTSSETLNAALRSFAEAESDGIVEVTTSGAADVSGAGSGEAGARLRRLPTRSPAPTGSSWRCTLTTVRLSSSTRSSDRCSRSTSRRCSHPRRPRRGASPAEGANPVGHGNAGGPEAATEPWWRYPAGEDAWNKLAPDLRERMRDVVSVSSSEPGSGTRPTSKRWQPSRRA